MIISMIVNINTSIKSSVAIPKFEIVKSHNYNQFIKIFKNIIKSTILKIQLSLKHGMITFPG